MNDLALYKRGDATRKSASEYSLWATAAANKMSATHLNNITATFPNLWSHFTPFPMHSKTSSQIKIHSQWNKQKTLAKTLINNSSNPTLAWQLFKPTLYNLLEYVDHNLYYLHIASTHYTHSYSRPNVLRNWHSAQSSPPISIPQNPTRFFILHRQNVRKVWLNWQSHV